MARTPLVRGALFALAAAASFGIATPLISLARGAGGSWFTAAALYGGAALFAATIQGSSRTSFAAFRRNAGTYVLLAIVGGAFAPAAFAAGLALAGPLASSLALNLEVVFSIALAAFLFGEHIGGRVVFAATALLSGGVVLAARDSSAIGSAAGVGLVVLATLLWALDNAVSSTLRAADSRVTVFWKSLLGATLAFVVSRTLHETIPSTTSVTALAAIGAIGYGASLWCYLRAQQEFGVARTASVFAVAPFLGAIASLAIHPTPLPPATYLVVVLMALGIFLHATERHAHPHRHLALEHVHVHRHDDEHHDHDHDRRHDAADAAGTAEHLHTHRHDERVHDHDHAPDPHHAHDHDHLRDDPRSDPAKA